MTDNHPPLMQADFLVRRCVEPMSGAYKALFLTYPGCYEFYPLEKWPNGEIRWIGEYGIGKSEPTFLFLTRNGLYRLSFQHFHPPADVGKPKRAITGCRVQVKINGTGDSYWLTLFEAEYKHPAGRFVPAIGRKVALTRALLRDRALLDNKPFRRMAWTAYFHGIGVADPWSLVRGRKK